MSVVFSRSFSSDARCVCSLSHLKGPVDLPKATVTKLMRQAATDPLQVTTGANVVMSEAARLFMHLLAFRGEELAKERKRAVVTPEFVLEAVADLEFDWFLPTLRALLEQEQAKKEQKKQEKQKQKEAAAEPPTK